MADLLDCVKPRDVILLRSLDSDALIEIRERVVINKSITITADPPLRRGGTRARFTCPETEMSVFDIWYYRLLVESTLQNRCEQGIRCATGEHFY